MAHQQVFNFVEQPDPLVAMWDAQMEAESAAAAAALAPAPVDNQAYGNLAANAYHL